MCNNPALAACSRILLRILVAAVILGIGLGAQSEPAVLTFDLPAQSGDRALLAFSRQAKIDILFSYEDLRRIRSNEVIGRFDPTRALEELLKGTGFTARRTTGAKWVVSPSASPKGSIKGKVLAPDGTPARRISVRLFPTDTRIESNRRGEFEFHQLEPGVYRIEIAATAARPVQIENVKVTAGQTSILEAQPLQRNEETTRMEPYVVQARTAYADSLDHSDSRFVSRNASGNLDLARTESDALPYMIFNRTQIARSGVVNLNEFLQRELIDSMSDKLPPEQNGQTDSFVVGSTNLRLRGYEAEETVVLVNGRRLPEVLTSGGAKTLPPDVNFIPLSLVQQVEVLPVSASALYSGNAVGGVINIVLRPDVDARATEVTATCTNAFGRFDAPQSSLSLLHAESLMGGALRFRINANFAEAVPATEAELKLRQRRSPPVAALGAPLYRATPNVRSASPEPNAPAAPPLPPLARLGSSPVTSVAPGSDGRGGLAAFVGRSGIRSSEYFDSPGSLSSSIDSLDHAYGREQRRATYYGSVTYDVSPWLQLAADGMYSSTEVHRGFDVMQADLRMSGSNPLNPFGQDVVVSLNETAPALGEDHGEARMEFGAVVLGALVKLPEEWRVALDAQYSNNVVKYRGLAAADKGRWEALIETGGYNPLRDTQVFGPPQEFYDQVLIFRGYRDRFTTLGNYQTLDLALRVRNEKLNLPTGTGAVNAGVDFRRNHLDSYKEERRYSDGTLAAPPVRWDARTLDRYSFFGELQGALLPAKRLPRWIRQADADTAVRYVASRSSRESNVAPTFGLKLVFPAGVTLRGSITTSSRFPTPTMSRLHASPSEQPGTISVHTVEINDPMRNERYRVAVEEILNADLNAEEAVTQTMGVLFQAGRAHRFRTALDYVDTTKSNELTFLDENQVILKESLWPERVIRTSAEAGRAPGSGRITTVITGRANLWSRRSQDLTASLDYKWNACLGGTLEAYARALYFHRYKVRTLPDAAPVDELRNPDGMVPLLKYRANFGVAWSNQNYLFGADGHYFHSRLLPRAEWEAQGRSHIRPFWQFDGFVQADVGRWIPWKPSGYGLRAQFRVNNVFGTPYPKYVHDSYGTGVQPYGDWRGRTYSLSITATY